MRRETLQTPDFKIQSGVKTTALQVTVASCQTRASVDVTASSAYLILPRIFSINSETRPQK
jgi:hypothetical protein